MKAELFRLHAEHELRHWWFMGRRRILRALVHELIPPSKQHLVIDVGCGSGANTAALAEHYECIGIDTSPDGIALAQQRFPNCRFMPGSAPDDLGEHVHRADLFLLMDVLEHVRDDLALFGNIMAAAKPGARALITVPANPALWSAHDVAHMHYRRYTRERMQLLWEGQPLTPLLIAPFNRRLYPLIRLVRALGNMRGRAAGRDGTDLSLPPAPVNRLLENIFAGEANALLARLRRGPGGRGEDARNGASLLAIVRREDGPMQPRALSPALAAMDLHDPERAA